MAQTSLVWLILSLSTCYGSVHIGGAFNIFNYFGNLGKVINLGPPDHRTVDVFEEVSQSISSYPQSNEVVFNGDFQLELCDNMAQVKAALFKQHSIERCDRAWHAYTGGWNNAASSRHLGLLGFNTSLAAGPHGYVLVRLTRSHQTVKLAAPDSGLKGSNRTAEGTARVTPGDVGSVMDFIQAAGSHYVDSYVTGDSLFQVFVFTPEVYEEIRKTIGAYKQSNRGLEAVLRFFSPWHARHIGSIVSASGNASLELWAAESLRSGVFMVHYSSLLRLHSQPQLLRDASDMLGPDAVLSARLNTLAVLFEDDAKRTWFEEVLDNHIKLWDLSV